MAPPPDTDPRPPVSLARSTAAVTAGSAVALLGSLVARVIMARSLDPGELGILLLAVAVASGLGGLASLGINPAVARRIAHLRARGDTGAAHGSARTALAWTSGLGLAGAALLALSAPWLAPLLSREPGAAQQLAPVLARVSPMIPALAVGFATLGVGRGFDRVAGRVVLRDGGGGVLRATGVTLAALTLGTLPALAWGFALGVVAGEVSFLVYGRAQGWFRRSGPRATRRRDHRLLASLPPFTALEVLRQLEQWADLLVLGALLPARQVGFYGLAKSLVRAASMLMLAAGHGYLPAATAAWQRNRDELLGVYLEARRLALSLLWAPLAVLLLAPELPLEWIAGEAYRPAAPVVRLLALGLLVEAVLGYKDQTLLAVGRAREVGILRGLTLATGLGLVIFLASRHGAVGAAAAVALTAGLRGVLLIVVLRRHATVRLRRHDLAPGSGAALVVLALGWLVVVVQPALLPLPPAAPPWAPDLLALGLAGITGLGGGAVLFAGHGRARKG